LVWLRPAFVCGAVVAMGAHFQGRGELRAQQATGRWPGGGRDRNGGLP
jgi:hypothetical protein